MKKMYKNKLLKAANYSFIGLICQLLLVNFTIAHDAGAQKAVSMRKVNIETSYQNVTLKEVFTDIESKTDFVFTFDLKDNFLKERFSKGLKKATVEEVLKEISSAYRLAFQQINNNISVSRPEALGPRIEVKITEEEREVNGKVVAASDNQGLPGVTILVKGTTIGTVTDID